MAMPGLVPGIHGLSKAAYKEVNDRYKPGHGKVLAGF